MGIATRSADPGDRRKVTVAINPDSLAALQPVYDTIDRAFDEVLASYTDSELALLVRYFTDTITLTDKLIAQLHAQKIGEPEPTPGRATGSQGGAELRGDRLAIRMTAQRDHPLGVESAGSRTADSLTAPSPTTATTFAAPYTARPNPGGARGSGAE